MNVVIVISFRNSIKTMAALTPRKRKQDSLNCDR